MELPRPTLDSLIHSRGGNSGELETDFADSCIARTLVVQKCAPGNLADCTIVFSGLDADATGDIGEINLSIFSEYLKI